LQVPNLQIVDVSLEDLQALKDFSRQSFYASFGDLNLPENMQLYDVQHFADEQLRSELKNPDSRFFFAKLDKDIVGYVKTNQAGAQTVLPNDGGMELERIYVDRQLKSRGIGKALLEKTVMLARKAAMKYIWLGVWEHNHQAIRFYERNGFLTFSQHIFKLGQDEQTDLLMKRAL
jgi:ribosomal protein S18 acetylase RimI-like enzyme